ncbi:MAG: nucleoside triphosphate pyrophosphohydrolase [Phormidesmis priestleyi]|uniref:Nucleoside triphosphate pyrophosphohydrolase n=1 Tax=Phormidesmis priestleyi TaxID=268141 RepID=A0A2W4Y1I4_9CYAN|nr:MAG: nucleoside triphosphate pyrophosphohydrolase [Phormidesmis priestleyi]
MINPPKSTPTVAVDPCSDHSSSALLELQKLIAVIAQLRDPVSGCPWDLAQTPQTLTPYVIEEAYEAVDAIQSGDKKDILEELGDLLLQVVLQAQIFQEQGDFDLGDIARCITEKMIRRHPHVFSSDADQVAGKVTDPEAVNVTWEQIKAAEKADTEDPNVLAPKLRRYARSLPPLLGAMKISKKAAKAGFEWDTMTEVSAKVDEEMAEFHHALAHESKAAQESELGDVLFSLIQVARWQGLDPAAALQGTSRRFVQRFEKVEEQADKPLNDYSAKELNAFWNRAKQQISQHTNLS